MVRTCALAPGALTVNAHKILNWLLGCGLPPLLNIRETTLELFMFRSHLRQGKHEHNTETNLGMCCTDRPEPNQTGNSS